jgi:hypothetical protein
MRSLVPALLVAVVVATPLFASPQLAARAEAAPSLGVSALLSSTPAAQAVDVLPSPTAIQAVFNMNLTDFKVIGPKDGWDATETFDLSGGSNGPPVPVHVGIYASELPTEEAAAGFIQAQLQQYRNMVGSANMTGNVGPAPAELGLDADEVYLGTFETPAGAASRILTVLLVARYGELVTAVDTGMMWDTPGPISDDDRRGLGQVTGALAALVEANVP